MENLNRSRARVLGVLALLAVACALIAWPARAWAASSTTYDSSTHVASAVASGTTTYYDTLADAVSVADSGSTVTLLANTSVSSQIQISKTITLDLNGKTLTLSGSLTRQLYIASGGSVIIKDSGSGGTITNTGSSTSYGLIDVRDGGTLTVESGTFTDVACANGSLIRGRSGSTIVISGGTFSCTGTSSTWPSGNNGENLILSCTTCTVTITGGTFKTNAIVRSALRFECGCTVNISNATISTAMTCGVELAGNSSGSGSKDTATLTDVTIKVDKTTTYSESAAYLSSAVAAAGESTVTINSGTYSAPYAVYVWSSGGTVTINGGTFTGSTAVLKADAVNSSYYRNSSAESAITVYDGTFSGDISIQTNTSNYIDASLTIYHGDFTSEDAADYVASTYTNDDGETVCTVLTEETNEEDGTTYQLVHALVSVDAAEATCTKDGNVAYYVCSYEDCGSCFLYDEDSDSYTEADYDSEIAITATGHRYEVTETVDPTCTEDGYVVYTCENDSTHTYTEALAAAHTWDDGVAVWSDDYSSVTVTWTCKVCGETYSETSTEIYSYTDDDGNTVYYAILEGPVSTEGGWYFEEEAVADDATSDSDDDESELASTGDSTAFVVGCIAGMGALALAAGLASRRRRNAA